MSLEGFYEDGARIVLRNGTSETISCQLTVAFTAGDLDNLVIPIRIYRQVSGALLVDEFRSTELDESLWHKWIQDEGLKLNQGGGTFTVLGTTGQSRLPKNAGFRFTGYVSKMCRSQDCVLIAQMRVRNGISDIPGMERHIVHLCGSSPDWFLEVVYGKDNQNRSGWFQYWSSDEGRFFEEAPVLPDESADEFRDVRIDYFQEPRQAQGFLRTAEGWTPVGDRVSLPLSSLSLMTCPLRDLMTRRLFLPSSFLAGGASLPFHSAPRI